MPVQAKLRCIGNTPSQHDPEATYGLLVRFTPVYDPDPESPNYSWSQATPSGYVELYVSNPVARDAFKLNAEYLVTFEEQPAS